MKETLYLSQHHESFPTIIEGNPALIRLDLKAKELAPSAVHTYYLRLPYQISEEGYPSESEMNRLAAQTILIEDAIMEQDLDLYAVGSLMYGGVDTMIYVSEVVYDAKTIFSSIMEMLDIKNYAAGEFIDDNWAFYDQSLYPSIYDFNTIRNRNQCMQLETMINTSHAFPIDFYFAFTQLESAQGFMADINQSFELVSSETDQNGNIIIQLNASMAPTFKNMNIMTQTLIQSSLVHDGEFTGWGVSNLGE